MWKLLTVDFYIGLLKLKPNRKGLYTHSNQVKLLAVVLKRIILRLEMTVKKEISQREKTDWLSRLGQGAVYFPKTTGIYLEWVKKSERDEQCERRGCKERGLIPNVNILKIYLKKINSVISWWFSAACIWVGGMQPSVCTWATPKQMPCWSWKRKKPGSSVTALTMSRPLGVLLFTQIWWGFQIQFLGQIIHNIRKKTKK